MSWLGVVPNYLDWLFTIFVASYNQAVREALLSRTGERQSAELRTFLTVLNWHSQTPPAWLAQGVFKPEIFFLEGRLPVASFIRLIFGTYKSSVLATLNLYDWATQCNKVPQTVHERITRQICVLYVSFSVRNVLKQSMPQYVKGGEKQTDLILASNIY